MLLLLQVPVSLSSGFQRDSNGGGVKSKPQGGVFQTPRFFHPQKIRTDFVFFGVLSRVSSFFNWCVSQSSV